MQRSLIPLVLGALILLTACGGGGDGNPFVPGNAQRGADVYAMPFLPTAVGENLLLSLVNLSTQPAPVAVTAFTSAGVPYATGTVTVTIPAQGGRRLPVANFTGGDTLGGWLRVDTRDLTTLDPVTGVPVDLPTTGRIVPVIERTTGSTETDAAGGNAGRSSTVAVTRTARTLAVQLVNWSYQPLAGGALPTAVDYDVFVYDAFGALVSSAGVTVPGNGSAQIATAAVDVGLVVVRPTPAPGQSAPADTVFRHGLSTLEDDPQVHIEARYLEPHDTSLTQYNVGFDVDFGIDDAGNVYDFGVYVGNPTDGEATVVLDAVYDGSGNSMLASPRAFGVQAHGVKLEATTTADSRGLQLGEPSIFADLFGDVDLATGAAPATLVFSVPHSVDISTRAFDSRFKAWRRVEPGYRLTTDVMIPSMNVETVATGGTRNYVVLMNPSANAQTFAIRGYTPGGTEYILDSATIAPFSQLFWSADGSRFTEDPSDPTQTPVPFMDFLFSGSGGIFFDGRRVRVDVLGVIKWQRPFVVRNLRQD